MSRRKKRLLENEKPNPDTLEANMSEVIAERVFPLLTAAAENERVHAGQPPEENPSIVVTDPRGARKIGTVS